MASESTTNCIWDLVIQSHSALQPGEEEQGGELEAGRVKLLLAEALTVLCTE